MAEVQLRATVGDAEQDITLDDEALPEGLLSLRQVREQYVPRSQLDTVRKGIDAEIRKATEGRFTPTELLDHEDALQALLPDLAATHREALLDTLGVKPNGEPDPQVLERMQQQLRRREVEPLAEQVATLTEQVQSLRVERLRNEVLAACREIGVVDGIDDLLALHYQQRTVWDDEHQRWFVAGPDGRPDVQVSTDRPDGAPPFRTVLDDLADIKAGQDAKTRHWFASKQREGIGYGGASRTSAGPGKPRDEMTNAEKSAYIKEHGYEAFTKLPTK